MKLKIVMKVQMNCRKCRKQALQHAAVACGVTFVGLQGSDKDQVVVIGEDVDAVKLAAGLRKKVGYTELVSVAELK